jgi:hypothetical protein
MKDFFLSLSDFPHLFQKEVSMKRVAAKERVLLVNGHEQRRSKR